MEKEMEKITE
jgi:hypothetical protein